MALQVDKWVAVGIDAVKWSNLADMTNATDVATWCAFFDFNVAALWVDDNPQSLQLALHEGFERHTSVSQEDMEHARMHIAVTLATRANDLLHVDAKTAERIRAIVADQLPAERKSARNTDTAVRWAGLTAS
jgi:hypothetical protein